MIQRWIECIPRHIEEVIRLDGDNKYQEGALDTKENRARRTEDERQRRQESVEARLAEAVEAAEAAASVEDGDDNNIEDVDDAEWDNDVAIDLKNTIS